MAKDDSVKILNILLREELSAIDTYQNLSDNTSEKGRSSDLKRIQSEHEEAARMLRDRISRDGTPSTGKQAWETVASILAGTRNPLEDPMAIKALKEGETQVILSYEQALRNEMLDTESRQLIDSRLLPKTREHLPVLDRLLSAA